ncbi:hypothetical protein ACIFOE_25845 [Paenibacillus sp. NRS-1783]|uniref:hypothetical protein n=1 Tax=Paenibacillus sp. NRS-1783 TaxID=3233907 RepID=UPI003D2B0FCF
MSETPQFWQLDAFSKKLDQHFSTVNRWFNALEDRKIHYVQRVTDGTRVYSELDLNIGLYIKQKRDEKWSFDGIYSQIIDDTKVVTRPFPDDYTHGNELSTVVVKQMTDLLNDRFAQIIQKQEEYFTEKLEDLTLKMRQKSVTDMITNNRTTNLIRLEGLKAWESLPASERLEKKGLFRKQENTLKKKQFLTEYELEHYPKRLQQEMNLEPKD